MLPAPLPSSPQAVSAKGHFVTSLGTFPTVNSDRLARSRAWHAGTPGRTPKAFGTGTQAGRQQIASSPLRETPALCYSGPTMGTQIP